jgi:hypothetical protein
VSDYQLFDALPPTVEAALRASIERFGVLVPIVTDQHGNVIDGHHRKRIADELKVKYRVDLMNVDGDEQAREIARTLNADRRQLTDLSMFNWVVIGAQTETRQPTGVVPAFDPPFEWVHRLVGQAKEAGCRVHLKPNLRRTWWLNEYPDFGGAS